MHMMIVLVRWSIQQILAYTEADSSSYPNPNPDHARCLPFDDAMEYITIRIH